MTYFPINLILMPFILFLVVMKSPRLNDFVLKLQYTILVLCYCFIGLAFSTVVIPLLYFKCVFNSFYMLRVNKR